MTAPEPPAPRDDPAPHGTRADGPWVVHRHRVIYGDTDAMGIVYYGNYLRFFEVGRAELVRARGGTYRGMEEDGLGLPVTEVGCRYHHPARYDDVLEIATRVDEVGRVVLRFEYRITRARDGALLTTGFTRHACVELATGKVARLPDAVRAWLGGHEAREGP